MVQTSVYPASNRGAYPTWAEDILSNLARELVRHQETLSATEMLERYAAGERIIRRVLWEQQHGDRIVRDDDGAICGVRGRTLRPLTEREEQECIAAAWAVAQREAVGEAARRRQREATERFEERVRHDLQAAQMLTFALVVFFVCALLMIVAFVPILWHELARHWQHSASGLLLTVMAPARTLRHLWPLR